MAEAGPAIPRISGQQPSPWRDLARVATFFLLVGCALFLWIRAGAKEDRTRSKPLARAASGPGLTEMYVGKQACRECHPAEHAAHSMSGHNRTLRPAGSGPLALLLDGQRVPDPEKPGITWSYSVRDGRLFVTRSKGENPDALIPIDYAVGSGQHATTFVTLAAGEPSGGLEHRLTYFAHSRSLALTPGQHESSKSGQGPYGYVLTPRQVWDCINCHSTRTSARESRDLDVATMIPNISCERCHGPGRSHVEKARSGAPVASLVMPLGSDGDASTEIQSCGICHRLPKHFSASEIRADNEVIARFPSVGLLQSKCYNASQGALRCTTCHDPHSRVSHEPMIYQERCVSCHRGTPQKICSVSPRSGCIPCHMPLREVGRGLTFTDHWIRVPTGNSP
jgi:Cytochrome c554 and c-prime